jgi:class 3 adenylate cyclase/tetratricopeptide (TPR) repeat protein
VVGDAAVGERRHLTVLFCDIAGSTETAIGLDPEEWHEIAREYQREGSLAVERFGGHVAKFLGDGILVYFGWPHAHDNDAERGVRAGLAVLEAVAALSAKLRHQGRPELSVRIGIHSGPAVIGEGGKRAPDIFGDTPNIAARVQAAAEPGTILITPATRRLISGLFLLEDLGPRPLKGIPEPLQLSRAVRPVGVSDRLSRSAHALPPFVGRHDELRMLGNRFERARDGEGQTVLIVGEAGIGKSRLLHEFRERIAAERHTWIDTAADALFCNSPFYPLKQAVDHALMWRGDEADAEKIAMLEASMTTAGLALDQALPLVARMLDLPVPEKYPAVLLSAEQERERLLLTLAAWTLGSARAQPMVIVLEDLHWADPSTLALVRMLVEQCATAPLFVVVTARLEFVPAWPLRAHHLQLTLNRLSDREVRQMIEGIAARVALKRGVVDTVAHRTSGVPLFVEELTRLVLDEGVKSASHNIPETLSGSLLARLDRLGDAKAVAETAAVIGRDFDYRMLRAVADLPEQNLRAGLKTLADADLIYVRGAPPEAAYRFKHALVRDAAYDLLLKSQRRRIHAAIATTIQKNITSGANSQPELVAYHFAEAGDQERASESWQRAGENSAAHAAFPESEEHFRHAISALALLPKSSRRTAREMQLQLAVGQVMAASRGYSAPETAGAYARARQLSESFDRDLSPAVILGLWAVALTRGDLKGARELADCALERCGDGSRRIVRSWAHYIQGQTRFFCGDLCEAETHLLQSVELYDGEHSGAFPQNPRIDSLAVAGATAWLLGRPATALERVSQAWKEAHELNLPFDIAFVGPWICSVLNWRGEFQRVVETSERMLAISTEHHFPQFVALAKMYKGSALCAVGRESEGLPLVRQGLDGNFALDRRLALPELLTWLAEAQMRAGALRDATSTLDDALKAAPVELYWRPETLRLRGEVTLRLAQSGADGQPDLASQQIAERDFFEARALSRQICARSLELRAASSLARLFLARGERHRIKELLDPVLSEFDEGLATLDLTQARQLRTELEQG